jgi:hypothetical protein
MEIEAPEASKEFLASSTKLPANAGSGNHDIFIQVFNSRLKP